MTKSELIEIITAKQKHLPAKDVELALKQILEIMSDALSAGERIEIRGFGSFSLHFRPPRQGRNPKTGEAVALSGKYVPHFKPGKDLRERVNDGAGGPFATEPHPPLISMRSGVARDVRPPPFVLGLAFVVVGAVAWYIGRRSAAARTVRLPRDYYVGLEHLINDRFDRAAEVFARMAEHGRRRRGDPVRAREPVPPARRSRSRHRHPHAAARRGRAGGAREGGLRARARLPQCRAHGSRRSAVRGAGRLARVSERERSSTCCASTSSRRLAERAEDLSRAAASRCRASGGAWPRIICASSPSRRWCRGISRARAVAAAAGAARTMRTCRARACSRRASPRRRGRARRASRSTSRRSKRRRVSRWKSFRGCWRSRASSARRTSSMTLTARLQRTGRVSQRQLAWLLATALAHVGMHSCPSSGRAIADQSRKRTRSGRLAHAHQR